MKQYYSTIPESVTPPYLHFRKSSACAFQEIIVSPSEDQRSERSATPWRRSSPGSSGHGGIPASRVQVILFLIIILAPLISSFAGIPVKTVTQYSVSTTGFTVGDVITTQRMIDEGGEAGTQFETRTAINASFLWMKYHQNIIEKGLFLKQELVSYSRKGQDNGAIIDIEARRLENASFKYDIHEHGTTRSIVIPRNSYDYNSMECPEARLDFPDNTPVTLKILVMDKMTVVKRHYRLVRNSHYSVGGKEYPCRIIDYSDQDSKVRRWIAWDGTTMVMYRQDGRGDKSSYSVQATSVTRHM